MDNKILKWIGDYCSGSLDENDAKELRSWLNSSEDNRQLFYKAVSDIKVYNALSSVDKASGSYRDIIRKSDRKIRRNIRRRRIVASAAAVALLVMSATIMQIFESTERYQDDRILPGTTKAVLELADGTAIDLTQKNLGKIAAQYGEFSVDEQQSTILYNKINGNTKEPVSHSIIVPIGAEYHFSLPDGTKVWLNSNSRITYPNFFEGETRTVRLQGEAYFDVAKDGEHPFIVEFGKASLEVTGTRFSISAYPESFHAMATLEEGSANVSCNGGQVSLVPGMQAFIDKKQGTVSSHDVDIRLYTSWVKGVFEYENMKLSDIAVQLSRWYDVEFNFTTQTAKERRFTGVVIKYHDLNEALTLIRKTSGVEFIIEGRKITVMSQ